MSRSPIRSLTLAALLSVGLLQAGCIDPAMLKSQPKDETAETTPAPEAPQAQPRPVGNNPAGGSVIGNALIAPDMNARPAVQNNPAPAAPAQPARPSFPKDKSEIYDKKKLLAENPNLIEVENKIQASDPLTAASQSYFAIGSRAQVLNLKHGVDLHHAQYGEWPSYDEFSQMLRQNNVELSGVYRWQVYAYDDSDGTISILEDRQMKRDIYEKAGLPVD